MRDKLLKQLYDLEWANHFDCHEVLHELIVDWLLENYDLMPKDEIKATYYQQQVEG